MSKPKTKADEMADLLDEVTVEDWDARLTKLAGQWTQAYVIRQHLAKEQRVTTAPPLPPVPPELNERATPASNSVLRNNKGKPLQPPAIMKWKAGDALDTALKIISRYPQGVTYDVYREEFERVEAARTKSFDRSYHKALGTLKRTRHVINYRSRFFSYDNLLKFQTEVHVGAVSDIVVEKKKLIGKWNVDILTFLQSRKGEWTKFAEIVEYMAKQFAGNANVDTQTAVTLRKLIDIYDVVEKSEDEKGLYRAKMSDRDDDENTIRAPEALASEAHH